MAVTAYGQVFHGAVAPEESPVKIGSLWVDLSGTATLKIATAIAPYTFAEISGSGALADGDYGDVTVGGSGTTITINDGTVTPAKMNDGAAVSVLGRSANSSGVRADIAASANDQFLRRRSNVVGFGSIVAGDIPAHASTHQNGGSDEISVTGLSGLLADPQTAIYDTTISNTDTGAQNNWAPTGLSRNTHINWNGASDIAVTGIAGGSAGQFVTFHNITSSKVATFAHQSASSSAGNKFENMATSAATPVAAGGSITYRHDGDQWHIFNHEQGAWITTAFSAGNFTADSGSWTVESGDVVALQYRLVGRALFVFVCINTSTVASGPPTYLRMAKATYGNFTFSTANGTQFSPCYLYDGGNVIGLLQNNATDSLSAARLDGNTITAATNLVYVRGTFIGSIT